MITRSLNAIVIVATIWLIHNASLGYDDDDSIAGKVYHDFTAALIVPGSLICPGCCATSSPSPASPGPCTTPASTTSAAEDVHYDVKDGDDDLGTY